MYKVAMGIYTKLFLFILISQYVFCNQVAGNPPGEKTKVFVMEIKKNIDPRMSRYVKLALEKADRVEADYVIIEMDTYGGAVTDADTIRTRFLDYDKPLFVFINKDAASAGALISIACDSIYMAPGASIGAATVVTSDGEAAPDKYQSYMRSIMRSTAEANGRDPQIAEAMVDQDLQVDSVSDAGKVITFSTSEAIRHGFCEKEVASIAEILELNEITDYEIIRFELSMTEKVISFFLNPFISGILILVIIGGIYFELQTPGVGFPIAAAFVALLLYLVPYYLNGLAENWEIAVFFIGIALIIVEVFVLPGFGLAGVLGITCIVGSLVLIMLDNNVFDFSFVGVGDIFTAIATTLISMLGGIVLIFLGGTQLTNTPFFKRVALQSAQRREEGFVSSFKAEDFRGKTGEAYTVLRPSGKVMIEGEIHDAYTRGEYIDKGAKIIVLEESTSSLQVREVR